MKFTYLLGSVLISSGVAIKFEFMHGMVLMGVFLVLLSFFSALNKSMNG